MSTRSIIIVTGTGIYEKNKTFRLYKHSDGYPTGNLPIILKAIQQAIEETSDEEENRFTANAEVFTGKIIGAATSKYGMGAIVEEVFAEKFKPCHVGTQGDLEWIYVLDLIKKTLNIYGGNFNSGIKNPETYVNCLREEYRQCELDETRRLVSDIEGLGFTINKVVT